MFPATLLHRRYRCQPNIVENVDHMFANREAVPYHSACDRQHCRKQCGRAGSRRFSRAILCGCVQRCRRPPCSSQRATVAPAMSWMISRERCSIERKASGPLFIQRCECAANMMMSKTAETHHKQIVIHAMLRQTITELHGKAGADPRNRNRPMHGMTDIAQHHYLPKCVSDGKHRSEKSSCAPHPVAVVAHFSGAVNGAG